MQVLLAAYKDNSNVILDNLYATFDNLPKNSISNFYTILGNADSAVPIGFNYCLYLHNFGFTVSCSYASSDQVI